MLEAAAAPVALGLERFGGSERGAEMCDVAEFVRLYTRMLSGHPWIRALIVQEVLAEGGLFREQFIEDFAGRFAPRLVALLRREQKRGAVRSVLDPKLAALSLVSLAVFPCFSPCPWRAGSSGCRDGGQGGASWGGES